MTLHPETQEPLAKIYRATELDDLLKKLDLGGTNDAETAAGEGTGGGGARDGPIAVST